MPIKAFLKNGLKKGESPVEKLKEVEESGIEPNELMVKITVRSEDPSDSSIFYDISPFHHPDMSVLSEEGVEAMTDVIKAMCVVTTFPPDEIAYLVERYDTMFDDEHEGVEIILHTEDNGTVH